MSRGANPTPSARDSVPHDARGPLQRVPALLVAYGDTLREGDSRAAVAVIEEALHAGLAPVEIQSRVIAPAMQRVGELWERCAMSVAGEHLATAVSHHALARLYPGLLHHVERQGETVVVAAVDGEHHVLGLRMVADVFEGGGYDVRFLGASATTSSLVTWVSEHQPTVVALGVTMPLGASALAHELRALRVASPNVHLVIGGQGVPESLCQNAGVHYFSDTEQLARYTDGALIAAAGELPPSTGSCGVQFAPGGDWADVNGGLEARLAQTSATVTEAARSQARQAFTREQSAFRDPLTRAYNRWAFDDRHHQLTGGPDARAPAIAMIDVDDFKAINDRLGHDAGDRALSAVASAIARAVRPGDFVARYGGDEFVVLLPNTTRPDATAIAERVRRTVEAELVDPPLTVSVGVSAPDHTSRRRGALEAERALHEAKESGRNQVVVV